MNEENLIEALIRGFSKPIILWLIFLKPMHGYNLMKEFKNATGRKLKPGLVYPFLRSLEDGGFIVGMWMRNGKRKVKNYQITAKGEGLLRSLKKRIAIPLGDIILEPIRSIEKKRGEISSSEKDLDRKN
ncbi:MAG: PadR family transcriptional regulator [Candidatus Bathyarchaeota archaeon]